MAKLGRNTVQRDVATPRDGTGNGGTEAAERYCALCGQDATPTGQAVERFGEAFCSEAHAEAFVQDVRAARVQAAAAAASAGAVQRSGAGPAPATNWKPYLGKALCWGAPLLIVAVLLAGGTGALAGAAGAILPFLAFLACPLAMYFMMRSMSKKGHDEGDKGGQK